MATVLVLAACFVLGCAGAGAFALLEALLARHRAGAAADLAALAAAGAEPGADGCASARRVAAAQGARLSSCRTRGEVVDVVAEAPLRGWLSGLGPARVAARAGPSAGVEGGAQVRPAPRPLQ